MKLKGFRVTNYQSVIDSGFVPVEDITCLVGKNEAGKSALLKALYKLNPVRKNDGDFNSTHDYPRATVSDFEAKVKKNKDYTEPVITATFQIENAEINEIEALFGKKYLKKAEATSTKSYNNNRNFSLFTDQNAALQHLKAQLPKQIAETVAAVNDIPTLKAALELHKEDQAAARIIKILNSIKESVDYHVYNEMLSKCAPKYLYFDEYYQMKGCENVEALLQRKSTNQLQPSDEPLLGLIELAAIDVQELLSAQQTQDIKNKLEGAGNKLTRSILPYWSQNRHIQMKFDIRPAKPQDPTNMQTGTNIWGEVYDTKQFATTGLGTRSKGFVWFFSFVAWYQQVKENHSNTVLLLDEPGLTLHGRAQADLLRYFEEQLKPNNQVIYSTHSPFMVDPQHFSRVRIVQNLSVEKEDPPAGQEGTKYVSDVYAANDDSLFPLQGALGYDIHQTLFVGPNSLLVEGPADMLYIQGISSELERDGREGLSDNWTLTPVGGSSKIPTFVKLLGSQNGLNVATLIDFQKSDKETIEGLYKDKLLNKANVRTFHDYTGKEEADIEDMFEPDFYLNIVNKEYADSLQQPLIEPTLVSKAPRILVRIEQHLKGAPLTKGKFSHYRPARYFQENLALIGSKISEVTKKRFEDAFKDLNRLLPK